jgi:protein mago nashi
MSYSLLRLLVYISPIVVRELKRIVETSDIVKYVSRPQSVQCNPQANIYNLCDFCREDDTNWPKKNIVGKQELEVRIGNDHIAFEVCFLPSSSDSAPFPF